MDLGSARLTQHADQCALGVAADDRVVDDDEPLAPDHLAQRVELEADAQLAKYGVFGTTLVAFFLAEMGDKTQVATVALAAQYQAFISVVAGTTFGMMLANVPAVLLGDRIADKMPVRLVHTIAAGIFALLGIATLLGAGESLGF